MPEISIIGIGNLGQTFTRALSATEIPVKSIYNRNEAIARELAEEVDIHAFSSFPSNVDELGKLIFLTVSDQAIQVMAHRLANLCVDFQGYTVVHCSGNESAELLQDLKKKGATTASFHPLQTFTAQSGPDSFKDIYFSMEGESEAFPQLKEIAHSLGAQAFEATQEQKSHLHIAAVMACNYLHTLLDASMETASLSDLPQDKVKKALLPLIQKALQNGRESSFEDALTGPIKRGDLITVEKHLDKLKDHPELRELYCLLGRRTIKLAESSEAIGQATAEKLSAILE